MACLSVPTFCERPADLLIIIKHSTKSSEINTDYKKILRPPSDATTTHTIVRRRHAATHAPPSLDSGRTFRCRVCYSKTNDNRRAKAPKNQCITPATIVNDGGRRSKETDFKPHQRTQKMTTSRNICRTHNMAHAPAPL
jgi:hypothetical protein